jgi:hypothetical protein
MKAMLNTLGEVYTMKAMAISLAVCFTAGCGGYVGYRIGCSKTKFAWKLSSSKLSAEAYHNHQCDRVRMNTEMLQYLADGNLSEARRVLEGQLDFAVVSVVAYERHYEPERRGSTELEVVRGAREYRSRHPWVSGINEREAVREAFKWAD